MQLYFFVLGSRLSYIYIYREILLQLPVGYNISPLKRVKFNSREWRNIVTHMGN